MLKHIIAITILVFALGWLSHSFYADLNTAQAEPYAPVQAPPAGGFELQGQDTAVQRAAEGDEPAISPEIGGRERPSPSDRLTMDDVRVTSTRVTIDAPRGRVFETAIFTNTNSMDPLIDEGTQAIQIVPLTPDEIRIGDIISYDAGQYGIIIHRVIQIGNDENGWYAIVQGDNNPHPDPVKVRFNMVRRVLVGVLY
jgi:hypothetical protein